jgi:hypothetical protein
MKIKQNSDKDIDINKKIKKELKAVKDTKLLSFGEEEEDLEEDKSIKRGMHSSHDSKTVKDPKLSAEVANDLKDIQLKSSSSSSSSVNKDITRKNIENIIISNDDNDNDNDNDDANEWDKKMRLKLLEKRMEVERRQGQYKPKISSKESQSLRNALVYLLDQHNT